MTEEKPKKKNYYEMEFCVKTDFGKITLLYDYRDAWNAFKRDFNKKYAKSTIINGQRCVDAGSWQRCLERAEENLKEIFPQIIFDSLEQAWFEARARTINELHNAVSFEKLESEKELILNPIQPLNKYNPNSITQFCKDVADKAYEDSHKRMGIKIDQRGGSQSNLGEHFQWLDIHYERISLQAKSILKFYKWKREKWLKETHFVGGDKAEKWNKYFLEIMFQPNDPKYFWDKITQSTNKKEKTKFKNLDKARIEILSIKKDEIQWWKEAFQEILSKKYSTEKGILFEDLTPKTLARYSLATVFGVTAGTIENKIKEIKSIKKEYFQNRY